MGLNNKLATGGDEKGKGKEVEGGEGWATSREEREDRLRKRKENLVLEARRYVSLFSAVSVSSLSNGEKIDVTR